jgi:hypothetical protein
MKPEVREAFGQGKVMTFNRVQATGRLLENAIKLWFSDGDPLSIHLLVSAVCRVLDDLGKREGKGPRIKAIVGADQYETAYDYLRHAAPEQPVMLALAPMINGMMLFDAVCCFEKVFGDVSVPMQTLRCYFVIWPDLGLVEKPSQNWRELFPDGVSFEKARTLPRKKFFSTISALFEMERLRSGGGPHIKSP